MCESIYPRPWQPKIRRTEQLSPKWTVSHISKHIVTGDSDRSRAGCRTLLVRLGRTFSCRYCSFEMATMPPLVTCEGELKTRRHDLGWGPADRNKCRLHRGLVGGRWNGFRGWHTSRGDGCKAGNSCAEAWHCTAQNRRAREHEWGGGGGDVERREVCGRQVATDAIRMPCNCIWLYFGSSHSA